MVAISKGNIIWTLFTHSPANLKSTPDIKSQTNTLPCVIHYSLTHPCTQSFLQGCKFPYFTDFRLFHFSHLRNFFWDFIYGATLTLFHDAFKFSAGLCFKPIFIEPDLHPYSHYSQSINCQPSYLPTYSLTHSPFLTHSLTHQPTHPHTQSPTHLSIHSLIPLLSHTHQPTHSLTCSPPLTLPHSPWRRNRLCLSALSWLDVCIIDTLI